MSDLTPREIRAIYDPPPAHSRRTRIVSWLLMVFAVGFCLYAFAQAVILWWGR